MRSRLERITHRWQCRRENVATRILLACGRPSVNTYWWRKRANFGDVLGPALLRTYGFEAVHHPISEAELLTVGSLLQAVPAGFAGTVLGSGFICDGPDVHLDQADLVLVRGELTRRRLNASDARLGDPGLLSPRIVAPARRRPYHVGLVPHLCHLSDSRIAQLVRKLSGSVVRIDVRRSYRHVLRQISRCRFVLSSSLHGLIIADAYGVPNRWLDLSTSGIVDDYKFHDYYSALRCEREPFVPAGTETVRQLELQCQSAPHEVIQELRENCERSFREYFQERAGSVKRSQRAVGK